MKHFLAITSRGLENLVAEELQELGASNVKTIHAGVAFRADMATAYRCCLWSRFASRIILVLSEFNVMDDMDLYLGASALKWGEYMAPGCRMVVDFNGTNREIRNSQYGALKVKDAIVDQFTKASKARPSIDKDSPDVRVHARLYKEKMWLGLDMVGAGLHIRGYRTEAGQAPLRETHAAALVAKSGWDKQTPLMDPMCGSGTILIEAAMMAADIAPGINRKKWAFENLLNFDRDAWMEIKAEAQVKAKRGTNKNEVPLIGQDVSSRIIEVARANAKRAGVQSMIRFETGDAARVVKPEGLETVHVVCNPPYGERLGSEPGLIALYGEFGNQLKREFKGCTASIYSGSDELLSCLRMRAERQFKLRNGALDCVLKTYQITARGEEGKQTAVEVAPDFANRLRKNLKKLEKWAAQEGIDCYRMYDADLPDYNAAVDRYADHVVIQEYAAPKSIPEETARRRLFDMIRAVVNVTGVHTNNVVLKTRQKQKGTQQYEKLAENRRFMWVKEYNVELQVNLHDYLDTGVFLDHRNTRRKLGQMAKGKDFLNLFAYTGSATVHAAVGGAKSTTTVDMSKTYLAWAERNMKHNGQGGRQHRFEHADCLKWLESTKTQYDLIFIDPPTFSNSKRMEDTFDVQRDHVKLMTHLSRILRADGEIVFSNNKRGFKMDHEALAELGLQAKDITAQSIPLDFARNKQIHNCWIVTRKQGE